VTEFLVRFWRILRGPLQWYILWFAHNKFMIGVSGIVTNDQGHILLLRHRFWPEGSWGLPSGYAEKGETLEQTIEREILEETGLHAEMFAFVSLKSGFKLRIEATYRGRITGGELHTDPREIIQAAYFPPDNLPEGLLPSHRELISLALSQQPGGQAPSLEPQYRK